MCKKPTKITFVPDNKRPVYCKSCLKKVRVETPPKIGLEQAMKEEPIPFGRPKKRERKQVDLEGLKQTLKESLDNNEDS